MTEAQFLVEEFHSHSKHLLSLSEKSSVKFNSYIICTSRVIYRICLICCTLLICYASTCQLYMRVLRVAFKLILEDTENMPLRLKLPNDRDVSNLAIIEVNWR